MKITNKHNLPLSIAVWLLHDDYEYNADPYTISVTTLLKPIRQIVLAKQNSSADVEVDLMDLFAMRLGGALHDSIEYAWLTEPHKKLLRLGLSQETVDRIVINPTQSIPGAIEVHLEQRGRIKLGKWTLSGKFDTVSSGQLEDNKSVVAFGYMKQSNKEDYIKQGSLYRLIYPDLVTENTIQINSLIKDWKKFESIRSREYPSTPIKIDRYPLWPIEKTQQWAEEKLQVIDSLLNSPEDKIPLCSDDDLWRKPAVYKYFKNPDAARSTANFDNYADAIQKQLENNGVGVIKTVPGEVKRCHHCSVFQFCKQKDAYLLDGSLKLEE